MRAEAKIKRTWAIPEALYRALERLAKAEHRTMTGQVCELIRQATTDQQEATR